VKQYTALQNEIATQFLKFEVQAKAVEMTGFKSLRKYNTRVEKREAHQIFLNSNRKWNQLILNCILKIEKYSQRDKKREAHKIYKDSKRNGKILQSKSILNIGQIQ